MRVPSFAAVLVALIACGSGEQAKEAADQAAAATPHTTPQDAPGPAPVDAPRPPAIEQFPSFLAVATASRADDRLRATLTGKVKVIARDCEGADTDVLLALSADVDAARPGAETVIASLTHGVVALAGGTVIATTASPVSDCEGSQTEPNGAWAGQLVPDPELEIVFSETSGGRNAGATTLHLYKRRGARFVEVLALVVEEYEGDDASVAPALLEERGSISHGVGKTYLWNPNAFRFELAPPTGVAPE